MRFRLESSGGNPGENSKRRLRRLASGGNPGKTLKQTLRRQAPGRSLEENINRSLRWRTPGVNPGESQSGGPELRVVLRGILTSAEACQLQKALLEKGPTSNRVRGYWPLSTMTLAKTRGSSLLLKMPCFSPCRHKVKSPLPTGYSFPSLSV